MASDDHDAQRETRNACGAFVASYAGAPPVTPPPTPDSHPPAAADKRELLAAFDKLVEHEATKPRVIAAPAEAFWRRFVQPVIIAVCAATMLYLWIRRPSWLHPTFAPMPMPADESRMAQLMTATSLAVQAFQADSGRTPGTLAELGLPLPGLSIAPTAGGGFELSASSAAKHYLMAVAPGQAPAFRGVAR